MFAKTGSRGELVKAVQNKLVEFGFNPGAVDRAFGTKTKEAMISFQESKGLKVDGIAGPISLAALGIDVRPVEPEAERESFKLMLIANPNYFGNLTESLFKPVKTMSGNTHYEEIVCLGYQPQLRQLEAVVHIYQGAGYGTDICGPGTPEFVRFYLSFDNGASWQDEGMTSFQAYNIPEGTFGEDRLEYAASLKISPNATLCWQDPLVKVRAILSWNNPPSPNEPNWPPVWGNVREEHILVEPLREIPGQVFVEAINAKLPAYIENVLDLSKPLPTKIKSLNVEELADLYKDKGVPVHRFAYKEIAAVASGKTIANIPAFETSPKKIEISPDIIEQLKPLANGDTNYEELKCIGLDPNTPDTLVGVIHIKKPAGYSGNPCHAGSLEYVTFWADFDDNGTFQACLGTASVRIYDLNSIPPTGIYVAVRLHVDLDYYRQDCKEGAKVVRVRATLSWNHPVSCNERDRIPRWGNRQETLIHVSSVNLEPPGRIAIIGNIGVGYIDDVYGLTTTDAVYADLPSASPDASGRPCPFAGKINVIGLPIPGWSYEVEVSPDAVMWTSLVTDLELTDKYGNPAIINKADPITKRYQYRPSSQNVSNLLAVWESFGTEKWHVRLTVYDTNGLAQPSDNHVIQLHNSLPDRSIAIDTGTGNCGKFSIGTVLEGRFVARDDYLNKFVIAVAPRVNAAPAGIPKPTVGDVNTGTVLEDDRWELDTKGMIACGYTVHLTVFDRAIVDSGHGHHWTHTSVGFCLEAEEVEDSD